MNCLGSLSYITAGAAFAWPSPNLPKLLSGEAPLHLDVNEASWVSLFFLGNLISPIPSGYLADKIGRQKTWGWSGLLPIISWILVIFSVYVVGLYIARFLIGLHLGIISTVNPMYVGEYPGYTWITELYQPPRIQHGNALRVFSWSCRYFLPHFGLALSSVTTLFLHLFPAVCTGNAL